VIDRSFRHFLRCSLATLQAELPSGYAAMAEALGRRDVDVDVDGERLAICGNARHLAIADAAINPTAYARASNDALRAILNGSHSLESAVLAELIELRGPLDDLVAFYEALKAYFNAAVRCPSFAGLLAEYLAAAAPPTPTDIQHHAR
jgi:hypothetical protein